MTLHDNQPLDLHDDDQPVGRIYSRREIITLLGATGVALLAGLGLPRGASAQTATPIPTSTVPPGCVVKPQLTEGPYFVDGVMNRMDIRVDPRDESIKQGLPLLLIFRLSDVTGGVCTPLPLAQVDVWHCDADGVYSGVQDRSFDTRDELWLRGYQVTDEEGIARFITIVPGWYRGRAVHIHFKIRTESGYEFTSQFFFDPQLIETIYAQSPYAGKGLPDTPNTRDGIYMQSAGLMLLELAPLTEEEQETYELQDGYSATFDIGLDLSDASVGAADGGRRGRP